MDILKKYFEELGVKQWIESIHPSNGDGFDYTIKFYSLERGPFEKIKSDSSKFTVINRSFKSILRETYYDVLLTVKL